MTKDLFNTLLQMPYGSTVPFRLYDAARDSRSFVQRLQLQKKLPIHTGCVNSICWNDTGQYILSGSDDQHLCVTHGYTYKVLCNVQTGHRANIFSAKFLPNTCDKKVISCSGDGVIIYTDLEKPETSLSNTFNCHFGTTYEVMTVPNDSHTFLSCGEDGSVRWFDLRMKSHCSTDNCREDILISCHCAVTALAVNRFTPYHLGVGCADSVRIFDRRMLGTRATGGDYVANGNQAVIARFTVPEFEGRSHRITSLCYSASGEEMLVNYSSDYIYLFGTKDSTSGKRLGLKWSENGSEKSKSSCRPLMKRLRMRGDWSDTGPNARPESELRGSTRQEPRSLHASLMQRMSDVLTRMFNNAAQARRNSTSPSPSQSEVSRTPAESDDELSGLLERAQPVESQNNHEASNQAAEANTSDDVAATVANSCDNVEMKRPRVENDDVTNSGALCTENSVPHVVVTSCPSANTEQDDAAPSVQENSSNACEVDVNSKESSKNSSNNCISEERNLEGAIPVAAEPVTSSTRSDAPIQDSSTVSGGTVDSLPGTSQTERQRVSETRNVQEGEEQETSFLMEVDTWHVDSCSSDDENSEEHPRNYRCNAGLVPASILQSIDEELRLQQHKVGKNNDKTIVVEDLQPRIKSKYTGHRNARTMIKEATFWGDKFIMSGSDCGHIFIWDRFTTELVMVLEADHHVVNCLQPHPFDPILASSGIDYDVKLWAPSRDEPFFDEDKAKEIIRRNEIMLEETKDTITVPASFMIRMLASLNHLRSGSS